MKSMTGKVSILFVGLFIILLSASRTSFICFGLAGLTLLAVLSFKVSTKKMILPIALLVLLISLASIYGQFFTEKVTAQYGDTYRFALTNYKTDGSYVFRGEIFDQRWRELEDNWLMGHYLSEYAAGRSGTYFHNWLSFWTNFGIVPFLLSVILIVSSLYRAVKQFLKDSFSPINQLLLLWSIFVVIAISFSRSYDFYYIWFVLFGSSMIDRKLRWRGGRLPFTSQTNKRSLKRKQKIKLNFG
jgi:O-antigen ligase